MANLLFGNVYYKDIFAGVLRQEPGERYSFTYDNSYLESQHSSIAHTLPKRKEAYISEAGLHSFFDNLIAEGWLESAQARLLGKRSWKRFELLLAFGKDCAGAVSVIDPDPTRFSAKSFNKNELKELAVLKSKSSLSGVQPKLTLVKEVRKYRPSKAGETSNYIAKFPSDSIADIVENEYLTTLACKKLLPNETFVEMFIKNLGDLGENVLIVKRFDRDGKGNKIHFEEFSQLLDYNSDRKYDASYKEMADFIYSNKSCVQTEVFRLFRIILVGILVGNTDMHLKNFAMFHTDQGLRLTPIYDQVAAAIYHPKYQELALKIGTTNFTVGSLKDKHIRMLAKEFSITDKMLMMAIEEIKGNLTSAKEAILKDKHGSEKLKKQIINFMEKRWNGTFSLIGKKL
ncbi:MAG TPA: hypothetical protein DIV86_03285 [Alphaproteobacteria bacterium]|nr:hypothetical protein [Alphaproteobacteria bacterium]